MSFMPYMVQKNFMSSFVSLYALYGSKKTLCPPLCPLCLYGSKKLYVLLCVLICLKWFKKTLCPPLCPLCLYGSKKTLCPPYKSFMVQKKLICPHLVQTHGRKPHYSPCPHSTPGPPPGMVPAPETPKTIFQPPVKNAAGDAIPVPVLLPATQ
jgi:hypothetical protein